MKKQLQTKKLLVAVLAAVAVPVSVYLAGQQLRLASLAEGQLADITVDVSRPIGPLPRPWEALAQGGEQLQTFLVDAGPALRPITPRYIRIDHLYDQFDIMSRNGTELRFDWTKLDLVLKQMAAAGAKPFLSLSYMPPAISSGDIVAAPKDWNEWSLVVQRTIEHVSGQLGVADVYYEVWNEPDLFGGWKMGGAKDYKQLYLYAARGAARAGGVKAFKFGGPATTGLYRNWMDQFFPFILNNGLRLDFFSWHRYDTDISTYANDVAQVDSWLEKHPYFSTTEKIVTELGPDAQAGGLNNTRAGAAHLVAVMRELMYKIKFGFSFSVTGAWGILGTPRYQALAMLGQLGADRLSVTGEGSWVRAIGAQKNMSYQVLLTNYDPRGGHAEVVPVTFTGLKNQAFTLRERYLNGQGRTLSVATTAAVLRHEVPMTANSVVLVELEAR